MAEPRLGNFQSCCRLCLCEKVDTLRSVFDETIDDRTLPQKILQFVAIEISQSDKVTTMVCNQCVTKVNSWHEYKKNCASNQSKLDHWLKLYSANSLADMSVQIKEEPMNDAEDNSCDRPENEIVEVLVKNEPMDPADEPMEEEYNELPPPLTPHPPACTDSDSQDANTGTVNNRECSVCNKRFSSSGNRRKHEKQIHGIHLPNSDISQKRNPMSEVPVVVNLDDANVPQYDDETFLIQFRVSRKHAVRFAEEYQNSDFYKKQSGKYGKISPFYQMLIFLWYLGHQTSSFRDVADRFDVTISSLHRIIRKVSVFISNLAPKIITWPDDNEKKEIELCFRENGIPNVIGAIDICHIQIHKLETDADSYMNRNGYYSVQMQIVCDHNKRIRDLYIGCPGSVSEIDVFRRSPLCANLEKICSQHILLGGSTYPLTAKLLVPFKDDGRLTEAQVNYNTLLSKNREVIGHTFRSLKQKFRQLQHVKLRNIEYIIHLIKAACVVYNVSIDDVFNIDDNDVDQDRLSPGEVQVLDKINEGDADGRRVRNKFVKIMRDLQY